MSNRIVAYCDLLGFSNLAVENPQAATQLLSDFYNCSQSVKVENHFKELELFLFSDFLFVQGDTIESVVNYMCRLYRKALFYSEYSHNPMLIRGGVARGEVITQQRNAAPQVTKNFIVSPALTHAVKMEPLVKGQRLLISANEQEEIQHFWNSGIEAITYSQPSLTPSDLFKNYRYKDLLWARDLLSENAIARVDTRRLIDIASKLFRDNFNRLEVVPHYAETLRICLLSYSSLLEPSRDDRNFIDRFVVETLISHPNAVVWLGFLESILLSRDAFAFQIEPALQKFFSFAVLSNHWGQITTALHQPEHSQLLEAVRDTLSVVIRPFEEQKD